MAILPTPKTRDSKYVRLAAELREQIESGRFQPGDRLPSYAQLQSRYGVGQNTAEKVFALLDREKLIVREPNRGTFVAERSRAGKTGAIGLLSSPDDPSTHPYYIQLLTAIQRTAHAARTEIVLLHSTSYIGLEKIDGLLLCFDDCDEIVDRLPPGLPAVAMVHPSTLAPSVVADDAAGTAAAMEYLLQSGHRRIAYLGCAVQSWANPLVRIRHAAYRDALEGSEIEPDARWSRPLFRNWDTDFSFERAAFARMKEWIEDDWRELGCTSLIAHNDDVAIGAIRALLAAGIAVPGDVSVVGFDGSDIATASEPRLTTVELPLAEIGARATKLLLELISADALPESAAELVAASAMLPARLRVRESTRSNSKE